MRRSSAIYPALMLALNCGLRDKEIRDLQWGRVFLDEAYLVVGRTKTAGGTGRTIPLNRAVFTCSQRVLRMVRGKFGALNPEWYVFPFGKPQPTDPTKPCTVIEDRLDQDPRRRRREGPLARQPAHVDHRSGGKRRGDETIQDIAGHVSRQMLKHYSHIRMDAKRKALESIVAS